MTNYFVYVLFLLLIPTDIFVITALFIADGPLLSVRVVFIADTADILSLFYL